MRRSEVDCAQELEGGGGGGGGEAKEEEEERAINQSRTKYPTRMATAQCSPRLGAEVVMTIQRVAQA